jgi:hypothetical protein
MIAKTVVNMFRIQDLRNKILFTVALLIIYRVGFHIPVPCFDQSKIADVTRSRDTESPLGRAAEYMQMFTGGTLEKSSLFGLGIMPYITSSIILMLLGEVIPALKKLRQEGQTGHKKIQEYTRYLTVLICVIQSIMFMKLLGGGGLTYAGMERQAMIMGIVGMTAGTVFLMWLGEQIDEYGIGNGISLIIMAGIISRMPWAIRQLLQNVDLRVGAATGSVGPAKLLFLACCRCDINNSRPAQNTDSAGKADARPTNVWRPETLFAASRQSWRSDADNFRIEFYDVSPDNSRSVIKKYSKAWRFGSYSDYVRCSKSPCFYLQRLVYVVDIFVRLFLGNGAVSA